MARVRRIVPPHPFTPPVAPLSRHSSANRCQHAHNLSNMGYGAFARWFGFGPDQENEVLLIGYRPGGLDRRFRTVFGPLRRFEEVVHS